MTDAKGTSQSWVFDARDRLTAHTDRINATTTYAYDANSNQLSITDAEGGVTRYGYDPRNLQVAMAYPDSDDSIANAATGHTDGADSTFDRIEVAYDALNRPLTRTDQLQDEIDFVYDLAGRLTSREYPDSQDDTFVFDKASRLLSATSARYDNQVSFTYTDDGLLDTEALTRPITGGTTYTIDLGYDADDRLTSITHPDGSFETRTHTDRAQLDVVAFTPNGGAVQQIADFTYDNAMRETSRALGNGLTRTTTYGRADNLATAMTVAGKPGLSFSYTYDANKNPISETTGGVMAPFSWTAGQDNEDRLTNWNRTNGDSQLWNLTDVGDWADTTINGGIQTRTHNDAHEVLTLTPSGGGQPQVALQHDIKGNLTQDEDGQLYTWDFDNRLTSTDVDADTVADVTFTYDAFGRQVTQTDGTGDGVMTLYVSRTVQVQGVNTGQVVAEYEGVTLPAVMAPTRSFTYGRYLDEPLALLTESGSTLVPLYYHRNRQYSIAGVSDSTGAVVEHYTYSPYGETVILDSAGTTVLSLSTVGNTYLHAGRRYDAKTGLYYYRSRYTKPSLGRFLSRDPIGYPDGNNAYKHYALSHLWLDPSGLSVTLADPRTAIIYREVMREMGMAAKAAEALAKAIRIAEAENEAKGKTCCDTRLGNLEDFKDRLLDRASDIGGRTRGCRGDMTCDQVKQLRAVWSTIAKIRKQIMDECWRGGDLGHHKQLDSARKARAKCARLIKKICE